MGACVAKVGRWGLTFPGSGSLKPKGTNIILRIDVLQLKEGTIFACMIHLTFFVEIFKMLRLLLGFGKLLSL